ncbi:cysteine--tRNA ligase [Caenispirillum salinarum]|uniref:cysteine--tRNA ligase n=1 Tax=Caenispirillum salinarum TaxID=859058 RepID=UPI00384B3F57
MTEKHPLRLFNSLGREVQEFQPIDPRNVRVYSCGPTVYNYAHIGNLRAYVFADTLRRVLTFKGYNVTHVINITDVGHLTSDADEGEDKMEMAASREKKSIWDIAAHYTAVFKDDVRRLNILEPSHWTPATAHIQEMIAFARDLAEAGYLYELEDGAYFDTSRVPDYGRLGLLDLEGQEAGARVTGPGDKRNPADFAVWRKSPENSRRQMEWHSPWGVGAPGWHLECSVMSMKYLGERFDIHTGGIDHRQVHHCNEIAQNQGYTRSDKTGANWWMHNEFLIMRDGKMSKSSGRFLTLGSLVDQGIHPAVYRLFLLGASYRSSLEFTWDALVGVRSSLRRMLLRVEDLKARAGDTSQWIKLATEDHYSSGGSLSYLVERLTDGLTGKPAEFLDKLDAAVSNDLGTPVALAHLNELLFAKKTDPADVLRAAAVYDLVLGLNLLTMSPRDLVIRPAGQTLDEAEIEARLAERTEARRNKDFARSDAIRDELEAMGVGIMDTPQGTLFEWLPLAATDIKPE